MANNVAGNPIILDTAVANWAALLLPSVAELKVKMVEWFSPVTPNTDTFSIQDSAGNVLLQGKCETANISQIFRFTPPARWGKGTGWFLQQISSGKIFIWYD